MPNEFNCEYLLFFTKLAKENGCQIKSLCNNYVFEIFDTKTNKKFFIINNCMPLNDGSAKYICFDKVALSEVLTSNNIANIEHTLIKNLTDKNYQNNVNLINFFLKNNQKIVIKDNNGSSGLDVYVASTKSEAKRYFKRIYKKGKDVAICPFVDFKEEYRCIMLDGKCEICFKKIRPFVVGDGVKTVKQLILQKYPKEMLKNSKIPHKLVLKKNEKLWVGWKHNLSCGATPQIVLEKELKLKLQKIAKQCTSLLRIRFCSVDIVFDGENYKVLEINSIVNAKKFASFSKENKQIVEKMYDKAFKKMLKLKGGEV